MSAFTLGEHEALIRQLVDGQEKIFDRLSAIELSLAEKRGSDRTRRYLTGLMIGFVSAVATTLLRLKWH